MSSKKDISIVVRAIDAVTKPLTEMNSRVNGFFGGISKLAKGLVAGAAAAALGKFFKDSIAKAQEAELSMAQLEATVASTGGAAGFSAAQLNKQAEALSRVSLFSTEAVQGGLTRLLTYTDIQGDMFERATQASLDMAQALGMDVSSAAEKVGNALNYPSQALGSLSKQGFRFTDEQKKMIVELEKTGRIAEAQAIILGELELAYAGSAEAAGKTFTGALDRLKKGWDGIQTSIGTAIIQNSALTGSMGFVADALAKVEKFVKDNEEEISNFITGVIEAGRAVVEFVGVALKPAAHVLMTMLGPAFSLVKTVLGAVKDTVISVFETFASLLGGIQETGKGLEGFVGFITGFLIGALKRAETAILGVAAVLQAIPATVQLLFGTILDTIGSFGVAAKGFLSKLGIELGEGMAERMQATGERMVGNATQTMGEIVTRTAAGYQRIWGEVEDGEVKMTSAASTGGTRRVELTQAEIEAKEKAQQEYAKRLEKLNDELTLKQVMFEQRMTEAQAKEWLQREQDLGRHHRAQVTTIEDAYRRIDGFNTMLAAGFNQTVRPAVLNTRTAMMQMATSIPPLTDQYDRLAKQTGLTRDEVVKLVDAGKVYSIESETWVDRTETFADALKTNAQAGAALAGDLGLIDEEGQKAVSTMLSLESSISSALADGLTAGGVIGIIAGATSLLKGFFGGKSPAQIAAERMLAQNTEVTRRLVEVNGHLLQLQSSGAKLVGVEGALGSSGILSGKYDKYTNAQGMFADWGAGKVMYQAMERDLLKALLGAGLGMGDLDDVAKDLGIGIRGEGGKLNLNALQQLLDLLGTIKPTTFGQDFTGQREQLRREAGMFDLNDAEQAKRLIALAGGALGSSVIGQRLGGIDVSSEEGRAQALAAVQQLFKDLPGMSAADLGGLSGQQFLAVLEDLKGFLSAAAPASGGSGVTGSAEPAGLTMPDAEPSSTPSGLNVTVPDTGPSIVPGLQGTLTGPGNLVVELLTSMDMHLAGIGGRLNTFSRLATMEGLSRSATAAAPTIDARITGDIVVTGVAGDPTEIGLAVGRALQDVQRQQVEAISRELYRELQQANAAMGIGALP